MRILQVINKFSHTSIPVEMAYMMAEKHDVDLVSLYDSCEDEIELNKMYGNRINRIYCCSYKTSKIKAIEKLKKIIRNNNYDIIQTHHTTSALLSALLIDKKAKLITTVHGNINSYSMKQNLISRFVFSHSDGVIYNSKCTMNSMLNWQKRAIKSNTLERVIYNGIDVRRIQNIDMTFGNDFRKSHNMPLDSKIVAQVGRLESVKNPLVLLEAFLMYLRNTRDSSTFLVFVGDGSLRKTIESNIHDNEELKGRVVLTGTLDRDKVYSFMHQIDLQVVPSLYEGFCNALYESISIGNCVMVSDIPVFREILNDFECIKWIKNTDAGNIAESIESFFLESDYIPEMINAQEYVVKNLDISICVNNYLQFYNQVLNN